MKTTSQLELAPPELAVSLKVTHTGRAYRVAHRLRPPQPEDWFAYEAALRMAVEELPPAPAESSPVAPATGGRAEEQGGEEQRYRFDVHSSDAALTLWNRLALSVEGYQYPADDWRELIPLAHREAVVRSLTLVAPAEPPGDEAAAGLFPLATEQVAIVLEAARAGQAYPQLVHTFRPPAVEDERRYRRLMAESLIVGGTRNPRTLLPPRLPALCRLYDSLVLSVEGYTVNGAVEFGREALLRHMDAWHKRAAVQALFGDASDTTPAETPATKAGSLEEQTV